MRAPADRPAPIVVRRLVGAAAALVLAAGAVACSDEDPGATTTTTTRDVVRAEEASAAFDALVACVEDGSGTELPDDVGAGRARALVEAALTRAAAGAELGRCLDEARAELERGTSGRIDPDAAPTLRSPDVPAFDGDFADPFLLSDGFEYYAYATNTPLANVPVGVGRAGQVSRLDGDALPELPEWTESGRVWAPAVAKVGDGYRLYYSTLEPESGRQCISVASSDDPLGEFVDRSSEPLICPLELGGAIDPSPIEVDGTPYLIWKGDGNCCSIPTTIWASELDADGTRVVGRPHRLIGADLPWEGDLVEGPAMIEEDGRFHLFYSANRWDTASYATGHAVCETVLGPCTKSSADPWLATTEDFSGPGGATPLRTAVGPTLLAFAAWLPGTVGYEGGGARHLFVQPLVFDDGQPVLVTPSSGD